MLHVKIHSHSAAALFLLQRWLHCEAYHYRELNHYKVTKTEPKAPPQSARNLMCKQHYTSHKGKKKKKAPQKM